MPYLRYFLSAIQITETFRYDTALFLPVLFMQKNTDNFEGNMRKMRAIWEVAVEKKLPAGDLAEIAQTILEEMGFTAEVVTDGDEAVEALRSRQPGAFDVVLMDIMMPRMNGLEAARLIRSTKGRPDLKTLPILAMSANAFDDDVKKSLESGMNDHLSKPIEVDKLTAALRRALK